jgi:hypothetical protein
MINNKEVLRLLLFSILICMDLTFEKFRKLTAVTLIATIVFSFTAPVFAAIPTISQVTAVTTPTNDNTPNYTFTTDIAGTITYAGGCVSTTSPTALVGTNNITFDILPDNTYSTCTITVTDGVDVSNILNVNPFVVDTTAPAAPSIVSPAANSVLTTAAFDKVDWSDVTDVATPVTYVYSASFSAATNIDGSFVTPVYTSGALSSSEIPTTGTAAGVYYVSVKAVDVVANSSLWTTPIQITVDNTAPALSLPSNITVEATA